jgi:hypothetical protein
MHTLAMTLNVSKSLIKVSVVLLLLHLSDLLPITDNQGYIVAYIPPESICQPLAKEIEKIRGDTKYWFL